MVSLSGAGCQNTITVQLQIKNNLSRDCLYNKNTNKNIVLADHFKAMTMGDISGQKIGRYQLLKLLGEGGMASIYQAYDTRLERDVAIKLIRRDAFPKEQHEQLLSRFEREAKSLARLSHPNIVKVYDYGEHKGAPYLVLEYHPGGDLKQRWTGKPLPWRDAIQAVLPIARALQFAHQQGVIHRDIKPSNIIFSISGEPLLSDFGIAKILEYDNAATLTGTGVGIGTPGYMAPEQWTGNTSPQSDQYGLGIVLYELVTGRKPYEADTPAGILIKQTSQPLPNPSRFAPDLPPAVEMAILKALDKAPANRYADMGTFIASFETLLSISALPNQATLTAAGSTVKQANNLPTQEIEEALIIHTPTIAEKTPSKAKINNRPVKQWPIITALILFLLILVGVSLASRQLILQTPSPTVTLQQTKTILPTWTPTEVSKLVPISPTSISPTPTITVSPSMTSTPEQPTLPATQTTATDNSAILGTWSIFETGHFTIPGQCTGTETMFTININNDGTVSKDGASVSSGKWSFSDRQVEIVFSTLKYVATVDGNNMIAGIRYFFKVFPKQNWKLWTIDGCWSGTKQ